MKLLFLVTILAAGPAKKLPVQYEVEEAIPFGAELSEVEAALKKQLGAPKSATSRAKIWYFEPKLSKDNPTGGSCDSIALIKTAHGYAVTADSIMNGDPCLATKLTKAQVDAVAPKEKDEFAGRIFEAGVKYEDAVKSFEAKLGKAAKTEEMFDKYTTHTWQYMTEEEGGECRTFTLVVHGSSSEKIWNLPCK